LRNADQAMLLITQSGTYAKTFLFYFREMTVLNGLIAFCLLCSGSFLGTLRTSKSFKLLTFWLLDLVFGSRGWMKQKGIFFLWKQIIILPPGAPIKLVPLSMSHPIISRSCLLIFLATFSLAAPLPTLRSMAEGPARDPTAANPPAESVTAMASSPTRGTALMAKGEIHELSYFFKKTSITDEEHQPTITMATFLAT
jgi:hypothetical protein